MRMVMADKLPQPNDILTIDSRLAASTCLVDSRYSKKSENQVKVNCMFFVL